MERLDVSGIVYYLPLVGICQGDNLLSCVVWVENKRKFVHQGPKNPEW